MSKKSGRSQSPKTNDKEEQAKPRAMLGWPGYRTREGRTGWDPVDADNEAAHMTGTIFQRLFFGRIKNPIYLILLGILGVVLSTPLVMTIVALINGNSSSIGDWLFLIITGVAGLAILVNFIKNLIANLSR